MKNEIIETFLQLKEKYTTSRSVTAAFNNKKNIILKTELIKLTDFLDEKDSAPKRIYCLIHNITEKPKCKCGTVIKTFDNNLFSFRKECSKCALQNPERTQKIKNTCLQKYGVTTNLQIKEVNEKRLNSHKTKEFSDTMKKKWNEVTSEELTIRLDKTKKNKPYKIWCREYIFKRIYVV